MSPQEDTVIVSVDRSGRTYINKTEVPSGDLRRRLAEQFATRSKKEVFLKADAGVPYGDVVRTMADIKGAGIERLGMVTEPSKQ